MGKKTETLLPVERITSKIYLLRNEKVLIDRDLAQLYGVETNRLKEAVKEILIVSHRILCLSYPKMNLKIGGRNLRPPIPTRWD